ncbi:MAG TPA: hypothetical protein VGD20_07335, partial [Sphingopyxis sp.]
MSLPVTAPDHPMGSPSTVFVIPSPERQAAEGLAMTTKRRARPPASSKSIAVMVGLERALDRHADIVGLLLA